MELRIDVARIEEISQLPRPLPLCFYVARQEILVRGRGQRERVVFRRLQSSTVQAHPLAGKVFEVRRTVEFHFEHVGRQQFGFEYIQRHVFGPQTHHLVQDEYDSRADEEFPELRWPRYSC